MKLASLFDGIGGFPLAATMLGIEPVWASEIEKNCIKVTETHFPNMKHYGSVTEVKGAEVEPVDIITFGSPCQDLSVAGKRAGLDGARSGLFMEAVRIIKEMRDGTTGVHEVNGGSIQPRYAVWENVPGAYSSNGGEDFRVVIESLAQVADPTVSIPRPHDGKWQPSGMVKGNGWSLCWRTLDAQYWGVLQRRRRIFLVADFGGHRASEIFFEREGVSRNTTEGGSQRESVTGGVEGGVRETIGYPAIANTMKAKANLSYRGDSDNLAICLHATQDPITAEERSHALGANSSQAVLFEPRSQDGVPRIHKSGICPTLNTAEGGQRQPCVLYNAEGSTGATLTRSNLSAGLNNQTPLVMTASVRRLTPLEYERLQGFPDGWTEGLSDSARYRALGNTVAVPCVKFILQAISR